MRLIININIFSTSQHGLLPDRSTCAQLMKCNFNWCTVPDVGDKVEVVFVDLRKAFDVERHNKLIVKLEAFGICSKAL